MSSLPYTLRDYERYQKSGWLLALTCYQEIYDMGLLGTMSPPMSGIVQPHFDGAFLHGLLMYLEGKRRPGCLLVDRYQALLGAFAMEHEVEIWPQDLERMQYALIMARFGADQQEMMRQAFVEYGRTGSLARFRADNKRIVLNDD